MSMYNFDYLSPTYKINSDGFKITHTISNLTENQLGVTFLFDKKAGRYVSSRLKGIELELSEMPYKDKKVLRLLIYDFQSEEVFISEFMKREIQRNGIVEHRKITSINNLIYFKGNNEYERPYAPFGTYKKWRKKNVYLHAINKETLVLGIEKGFNFGDLKAKDKILNVINFRKKYNFMWLDKIANSSSPYLNLFG